MVLNKLGNTHDFGLGKTEPESIKKIIYYIVPRHFKLFNNNIKVCSFTMCIKVLMLHNRF